MRRPAATPLPPTGPTLFRRRSRCWPRRSSAGTCPPWEHLAPDPLPTHLTAVPAMAKYGVADEAACYAADISVRNRTYATALARNYHNHAPGLFNVLAPIGFPRFLAWATALEPATLTALVSAPTAALLTERTATLSTPTQPSLAATDSGTLTTPLHSINPLGTAPRSPPCSPAPNWPWSANPPTPHDPHAISVPAPPPPAHSSRQAHPETIQSP
jgi:hypothetical protein